MNRLTKEQALIISAYTGDLAGVSLSDLHVYSENKLGRFIDILEFKFADIWEELREASKADFMALSYRRNIRVCAECGRELFSDDCWRCNKPQWKSA